MIQSIYLSIEGKKKPMRSLTCVIHSRDQEHSTSSLAIWFRGGVKTLGKYLRGRIGPIKDRSLPSPGTRNNSR